MAGPKGSKYYNIFLNYNIWLENKTNNDNIINHELFQLLEQIDKKGSLSAAADKVGISYRKAWGDIRECEKKLGFCLVKRVRGGDKGGNSYLSEDGDKLLKAYKELTNEIDNAIYKITRKFFHSINK